MADVHISIAVTWHAAGGSRWLRYDKEFDDETEQPINSAQTFNIRNSAILFHILLFYVYILYICYNCHLYSIIVFVFVRVLVLFVLYLYVM